MSGGVDSSVAAALLVEQGHEVIGVHMKLHDAPTAAVPAERGAPAASSQACCGLDDAWDARRVADKLGMPFYVLNLEAEFKRSVMDRFAAAYAAGRTPNPCVACNGELKFDVLLRRAMALGADALATGHYARTEDGRLFAAADATKDQSYFLFPVRTDALRRTRFPLGGMTKPEVRAHAERLGLVTAKKPESMEVCFLPDDDHARFVAESQPDLDGAGDIVDETGRVLGRHDAYFRYTVGQRRGLGLAGGPWFVLRVEPDARRVVVGPEERLQAHTVIASGMNWLRQPAADEMLHARIRHRGTLIPCQVDGVDPVTVTFRAPARAATPGQGLVLYAGDEVVAGGYIDRATT